MNRKLRVFLKDVKWPLKQFALLFVQEKYNSKVFCIGFNKTGTTSLGRSLKMLGFRNSSFDRNVWRKLYLKGKIDAVLRYTAKFDSCDDLPWLKEDMIPILDSTFPNSKFIYLQRNEESWKKSYYKWRYKKFGEYPDVDEAFKEYKDHEKFVMDYFKDWPEDRFIILDIKDKMGFKKLADFVGVETELESFPHFNKT